MTGNAIVEAGTGQADALARLHAMAFDAPWDAQAILALMTIPGSLTLMIEADRGGENAGFILCQGVADEAEVITLAVSPGYRRRGCGRRLIEAAAARLACTGARRLFLEVAANNYAAIALYRSCGFAQVGCRRGYYHSVDRAPVDALVLARTLIGDQKSDGPLCP